MSNGYTLQSHPPVRSGRDRTHGTACVATCASGTAGKFSHVPFPQISTFHSVSFMLPCFISSVCAVCPPADSSPRLVPPHRWVDSPGQCDGNTAQTSSPGACERCYLCGALGIYRLKITVITTSLIPHCHIIYMMKLCVQ